MKKERAIIIKDPHLRKARNELRILLKLWVTDKINSLRVEASMYSERDDTQKSIEVQKKISKLNLMEGLSICSCIHCGHSDKDMIFVPEMKQWLCIECNSERVHYEKLRNELQMGGEEIEGFLERLMGVEGIGLTRRGSRCDGYTASKKILDKMGIEKEVQEQFFELCKYYGGYCDCEIIFNAKPRFLE